MAWGEDDDVVQDEKILQSGVVSRDLGKRIYKAVNTARI
jgi:hypothetical protein